MNYETLILTAHEGVRIVQLNRPRQRNALNSTLTLELEDIISQAEQDDTIRVLVLTGNDQAFSSGADLKETPPPHAGIIFNEVINRLERLPKPTIAAIDGWCLAGGLELAMTCDLRIAADTARIGDWHVKVNSIGGAGATVRLIRILGLAKAKELYYTGDALSGTEACQIGLVNRVYPAAQLMEKTLELAQQIAQMNPITLKHGKQSLNAAMDLDLHQALQYSLQHQREVQSVLGARMAQEAFRQRQEERKDK